MIIHVDASYDYIIHRIEFKNMYNFMTSYYIQIYVQMYICKTNVLINDFEYIT